MWEYGNRHLAELLSATMTRIVAGDDESQPLRFAELRPYFSITVLECIGEDLDVAFDTLCRFLRRTAADRGQAVAVRVQSETILGGGEIIEDVGHLGELGFDGLYGLTRVVSRAPGWAGHNSGLVDVLHQLTIALRRNRLVAIRTDITTPQRFERWIRREAGPFRALPAEVLAGTFRGDGKMLWTRGTHRRRTTKADSRAVGGLRVQDTLNPLEDGSFALRAAKIDYQPDDPKAVLRKHITFSADKSRVAWKPTSFPEFLAAAGEALGLLEKALATPDTLDAQFKDLAVPERDLSRVRAAYDVTVADPDQVRGEPDADDERVDRAELLRDVVIEVRGDPASARAEVDIGRNGNLVATLTLKPIPVSKGFELDVRYAKPPSAEREAREIRDAIAAGSDLLTIYYESGHAFTAGQIARQPLVSTPFPNLEFADFTGYAITTEKPKPGPHQSLLDAIAGPADNSLFAWVVARFADGWLLCDDGAGEIADFLHLANDGTLTAIHVKAASNNTPNRHIAVTRFEQLVSQAEKNISLLDNETLIDRLSRPRATAPRVWSFGQPASVTDFVQQLSTRLRSDKTRVTIVQPHLLKAVYNQTRAATDSGQLTRDSYSLSLLDNLLHSTRRTVTARWDDLTVIVCA